MAAVRIRSCAGSTRPIEPSSAPISWQAWRRISSSSGCSSSSLLIDSTTMRTHSCWCSSRRSCAVSGAEMMAVLESVAIAGLPLLRSRRHGPAITLTRDRFVPSHREGGSGPTPDSSRPILFEYFRPMTVPDHHRISSPWEGSMYGKGITHNSGWGRHVERLIGLSLLAIAAAGLPGCDDRTPTGTDISTSSEGAQVSRDAGGDTAAVGMAPKDATALATIGLPVNQSKATSGALFSLTQTGTGPGGYFKSNNTTNEQVALRGQTNGGGAGVHGLSTGISGLAGLFESSNPNGNAATLQVSANNKGPG